MVYKVLILEDNEMDASLMKQYLNRADYNFEVKWVDSGSAYEKAVKYFDPDVIVSDYRLKEYSGLDAIHYKNMESENTPLVIVSGTIGEEKAVELIKEGATDFLIKNNVAVRLSQTVVRAIKEALEREKRERAELNLKRSEERFRMLFEHSLDGIIIGNPEGEGGIITANAAACNMLGYNYRELKGLSMEELIRVNEEKRPQWIDESNRKGYFQGELNMKRKNGSLLPVEVSSSIMKLKDGDQRFYCIIRDISDRKKYELNLEREKAFTDKALNSLPGIFYVLDENKKYIQINENVKSELGYTWEEMEQMDPLDLYFEEDRERVSEAIKKAFSEGQASIVARIKRKDGTSGHYFLTGAHFKQDGVHYILGTGIDVSDRIEAEKKIQESLKEKEILLTEIHHRVKNNLAVVSGMMELQAMESDNEELRDKLFDSQSRIKSIALAHELLYQEQSFSNIDFNTNIRRLIGSIAQTMSSDVVFKFDLDTVRLNINQALPCSLILNELVTNALKHAFANEERSIVEVVLKEREDTIYLSVSDNGIGLPEDFMLEEAKTMGFMLINILCDQLKSQIEVSTGTGTQFHLWFDKAEVKGVGSSILDRR